MRRAHIAIGWLEAFALLGFAISIVVNANRVHSTVGNPLAEAVIFAVFGVAIAGLTRLLQRGAIAARTPFALVQVFVVIAGLTFAAGSSVYAKGVGAIVTVAGAVAFAALVRSGRV